MGRVLEIWGRGFGGEMRGGREGGREI